MTASDRFVSLAQLAREFGIDPRAARSILDRARVVRSHRGFPADEARAAIVLGDDVEHRAGHAAAGRGALSSMPEMIASADSRRRMQDAQTVRIEIQNGVALGRLVQRDQVRREGELIIATAREQLLSIGHVVARKVARLSDELAIARVVEDELRMALDALATKLLTLGDRVAA